MAFYGMLVACSLIICAATLYPIGVAYNNAIAASRTYFLYSRIVEIRSFAAVMSLSQPNKSSPQYQNWLAVLESSAIRDGLKVTVGSNAIAISDAGGTYLYIYNPDTRP